MSINVDPERIRQLYWDNGKSAKEIGDIYGLKARDIYLFMVKQGIKRRSKGQAIQVKHQQKGDSKMAELVQKESRIIQVIQGTLGLDETEVMTNEEENNLLSFRWDAILGGIKGKCSPKIHSILKDGQIIAINDMAIEIGFDQRQQYHKGELSDPEQQRQYEALISEFMGKPMRLIANFESNEVKPTTTRGKTIDALEAKKEEERDRDINEIVANNHKLATEIESLRNKKITLENDISRIESDIRGMNFLKPIQKSIEKKKLELLELQKQELDAEIEAKTKEWADGDFAFAMMSKLQMINDVINDYQDGLNKLRGYQVTLKNMILKKVTKK